MKDSIGQVLWAFGFAGLGILRGQKSTSSAESALAWTSGSVEFVRRIGAASA